MMQAVVGNLADDLQRIEAVIAAQVDVEQHQADVGVALQRLQGSVTEDTLITPASSVLCSRTA